MELHQFSLNAKPKPTRLQKPTVVANLNRGETASPPSPEVVARRAYAIYENQGSQPGHELKHWLQAEAQLFGGVERESQMHPGSSLFITEH